ncbi:CCA tRNA nucleotidyltransferase [Bittarella massiliensis (ex Durand et al. 2017)]|uniref:tRNA nucleotidyltransferase n=1 Tax=Bittarella massiliensis (ex Durand et al. 2017) TaxID=1720313 RepID=A0AAW5KGW0_9FIRM|nr:tRNA nucleotidyltransferase [Bittarella massiliensis (ex Durand et al. 2017)]
MEKIALAPAAAAILGRLEAAGFPAYAVGGCVRDSLLGRLPHDWDVTTAARPEQVLALFGDCHPVPTGIAHGTVTLFWEGEAVEVTTFRVDGPYRDHRHPDKVAFADRVEDDLARRDFTVNALAYSPRRGLCDPSGGRADLQNRLIRCVGRPARRFEEDALRLLRAVRFAAQLGFAIHPATAAAMDAAAGLLSGVSGERVLAEWRRFLPCPGAGALLARFGPLFWAAAPALRPAGGEEGGWLAAAEAVEAAPADFFLRLALLCLAGPEEGTVGRAEALLARLRPDRRTAGEVTALVAAAHAPIPRETPALCRLLADRGREGALRLVALWRATGRLSGGEVEQLAGGLLPLLEQGVCLTVRELALSGGDLLALGAVPGPQMGRLQRALLEGVWTGRAANTRASLEPLARALLEEEAPLP